MSFFPAKVFFILYSLFIIKVTISVRDLDSLFLLSTQVAFNLSAYQCNTVEIICDFQVVQDTNVLQVTRIILNSKQLEGSLSPTIKRFTVLKELSVANNQLVGKIPSEIGDCRQLEILNLRNNRFSGKIPPDFSSLGSLRSLDLSFNHFSGNLNFLKHLPNLENLHLSNNLFSGKIPVSLHILRHLRFLNLSENSDLQSPVLDSLPRRYTLAKTKSSVTAYSPTPSPLPTTFIHKKTHTSLIGWISGVFVGIGAGIIASLVLAIFFKLVLPCFKVRVPNLGVIVFSSLIKKAEDLVFLEQTQGLDSLQVIGRGGCGKVYKKELYATDGDGGSRMVIAIKQIVQDSVSLEELTEKDTKLLSRTMRQVRSEIKIIGRIRHRNLVPLLAHVPRLDCHLLVYEFMKNGSLHDCLKRASEGNEELIWNVRHKIALGAVKGLEYLHMNHSPQIIHRDLKPANILLDDDMEARIADFGLAAIIPDGHTHLTASNAAGTIGYIAPEYHQTLKFTDKCDIFSFGVVLIILVTGRFPSDEIFLNTDEYQVKWLRNAMLSDNPSRIIDPTLIGNGFEEEMLLVLKIAWFCTLDDPKQRPNSKEIRVMLEQVKQ